MTVPMPAAPGSAQVDGAARAADKPFFTQAIRPTAITLAPLVIALVSWIAALAAIAPDRMTDLGLISVLPPAYFLAMAVLIVGFCLTLTRDGGDGWAPAAYVGAWIVVIHATPTIVYGSLRYSWAWKHVGIVDFIQRLGRVDPAIANLQAYHNWPGFFGLATLFTEAAGFGDALTLSIWAPVVFELLFAAAVLLILRASSPDARLIWLGVWFFTLTNWVGQDYFAPQALAYFFYLIVIGICLWAFKEPVSLSATMVGRWLGRWEPVDRLLAALDVRIAQARAAGTSLPEVSQVQRRGMLAIVLVLLAAIVVSHQLTPAVAVLALAALVVFGLCGARGLPLIAALLGAAWLVTGGAGYASIGISEIVASLGQAERNVSSNLIDPSQFTPGLRIVSNMARGLTAVVGILAVLGWIRRLRQGYFDLALTLLWLAPVGLLAISYGGEILFRVFFFALPFMAFFVAALFAPRPGASGWGRSMALVAVVSALLATGFLFAYFGHEKSNYFRPGEAAASDFLAEVAPDGALLVEASPNYPSRYRRYEQFVYVPLIAWPRGNVEESVNAYNLVDIERMLGDPTYPATYLVVTRGQLLELSVPGLASIDTILQQVDASGDFEIIYENADATVYRFTGQRPAEP